MFSLMYISPSIPATLTTAQPKARGTYLQMKSAWTKWDGFKRFCFSEVSRAPSGMLRKDRRSGLAQQVLEICYWGYCLQVSIVYNWCGAHFEVYKDCCSIVMLQKENRLCPLSFIPYILGIGLHLILKPIETIQWSRWASSHSHSPCMTVPV